MGGALLGDNELVFWKFKSFLFQETSRISPYKVQACVCGRGCVNPIHSGSGEISCAHEAVLTLSSPEHMGVDEGNGPVAPGDKVEKEIETMVIASVTSNDPIKVLDPLLENFETKIENENKVKDLCMGDNQMKGGNELMIEEVIPEVGIEDENVKWTIDRILDKIERNEAGKD